MKIENTFISDLNVITVKKFFDSRGYFFEKYHTEKYKNILGKDFNFVQDNISVSKKNVLRGLHLQEKNPQGKLVSVLRGEIYDVAVDLRRESKTFLNWFGIYLSDENSKQLWVPPGFAHGFVSLKEDTILSYKCTELYDPSSEKTILWNDEILGIDWPIKHPIISAKDLQGGTLSSFLNDER